MCQRALMKICSATYLHQGFGHTCLMGNKSGYKWETVAAGSRVLSKILRKAACGEGKFCLSQVKVGVSEVSR